MKTAVEFAFEELNKWRIENFGEDALIGIPQEVLDKAKEMEKKQIKDAYKKGKKYKKPIKDSNPIWLNSKPYKSK